jgi:urease accessory protein
MLNTRWQPLLIKDTIMNRLFVRLGAATGLLLAATGASAHTGHGTHGLLEGLAHPLGLDHLLAMVAVGVWSSLALKGQRQWLGPLTFVSALVGGAALGVLGLGLPGVESLVALSVAMLGAMLLLARQLPASMGLLLVAATAAVHGLAHGAEIPAGASFTAYAAGFVAMTAALHIGGLCVGQLVQRALAPTQRWTWRTAALLLGSTGLWLAAHA